MLGITLSHNKSKIFQADSTLFKSVTVSAFGRESTLDGSRSGCHFCQFRANTFLSASKNLCPRRTHPQAATSNFEFGKKPVLRAGCAFSCFSQKVSEIRGVHRPDLDLAPSDDEFHVMLEAIIAKFNGVRTARILGVHDSTMHGPASSHRDGDG